MGEGYAVMHVVELLGKDLYKAAFKHMSLNILSMTKFPLGILADMFFIANGARNAGLTAPSSRYRLMIS